MRKRDKEVIIKVAECLRVEVKEARDRLRSVENRLVAMDNLLDRLDETMASADKPVRRRG